MSRAAQPDPATRQVFLGFVRVHILFHAANHPVYGLWLIEELAEHGYRMSPGTLYPILHHLADGGLLRCSEALANGKVRRYYTATSKGRKALVQMQRKLRELVAEVLPNL